MKIIVVDDEPVIADTLVDILNGEGYRAVAVSDGPSAIRWAQMIHPDLVISDVIMPGMNGIETAKTIMQLFPACRIILFSGHAGSADLLQKAAGEGHHFEVLAKPINPTVLLSSIRACQKDFDPIAVDGAETVDGLAKAAARRNFKT